MPGHAPPPLFTALVLLVAAGCSRSAPQLAAASPDLGSAVTAPSSRPDAPAAPAPDHDGGSVSAAPEPVIEPVPLRSAVALGGDLFIPLAAGATTAVPTDASFRVEVAASMPDGRLSLRDEQDAMVSTSGSTEIGASSTVFRLAPEGPLRPGTAYSLHLDGSRQHEPVDAAGRRYRPVALNVKTAGEPPPAVAKKARRP